MQRYWMRLITMSISLLVLMLTAFVSAAPDPIAMAQGGITATPDEKNSSLVPAMTARPELEQEPPPSPVLPDVVGESSPTPMAFDPAHPLPSPTLIPLAPDSHPPLSVYLPDIQQSGTLPTPELNGTVVPEIAPSPEAKLLDPPSPDVVGGSPTTPGEWPWQARLDISPGYICGGTLIDPYWVLTAAHCVTASGTTTLLSPNMITVILGDYDKNNPEEGEQSPGVVEIIKHPDYTLSLANDIALLRLRQPAQLTSRVAPIPLVTSPDHDYATEVGDKAVILGWGMTQPGDEYSYSSKLLQSPVVIESNTSCAGRDNYFCVGNPNVAPCYGDSGGPLLVRDGSNQWRLAGVTSFTFNECRNSRGGYVRVSRYAPWIDALTHVRGGFLLQPAHSSDHSNKKCLDVAGGPMALANDANVQQWDCLGTMQINQVWRLEPNGDGFQVVAGHSSKCLDVAWSGTSNGTNVRQWDCNGTAAQRWRLISDGVGFRLLAAHSGKCLDVAWSGTSNGTNVQQWECNGTAAQRWNLSPLGMFQLVAAHSGKCLDVTGGTGALANGTNVHQWECNPFGTEGNQIWTLIPNSNNSGFQIMALHSGRCLDVAGWSNVDGANVHQWSCHGGANQYWQLVPSGTTFVLRATHSGKCLDIAGASQTNGANAHQWTCHGGYNQRWRLIPTGQYQLRAAHSNKCLDVAGGRGALWNGNNVHQWDCIGPVQTNQVWRPVRMGSSYMLVAAHSGKCLDIAGGPNARANGTNIHQWDCIGPNQTNQRFQLTSENGGFRLVAQHSLKCVDVAGGGQANGTNVLQWDCNGTSWQRWVMRRP